MNWVSIDFGTSYSSASIIVNDKPVKVRPLGGLYDMYGFPTVAYIDKNGAIRVCNDALPWRCQDPERFIKNFKLDIHENKIAYLNTTYKDIIVEILRTIRKSAEYAIGGESINATVITIPTSYSDVDPRVDIMREAAQIVGFERIEFLRESEAAAIYYNSIQEQQQDSITLVYDLGGGTFDPALIQHCSEGYKILGHRSGIECGGKYFDAALYKHFNSSKTIEYSDDDNLRMLQVDALSKMCRDIKETLSENDSVSYPIPILKGQTFDILRTEFEDLISPLLEKTFQECQALIHSAGKQWSDINRILLIGGSCAIPCVKRLFEQYLVGQNAQVPIIQNKSEEGIFIDALFAVSLGGIIYIRDKESLNVLPSNLNKNFEKGISLFRGTSEPKNWLKAAFFFYKDYTQTEREESYNYLLQIYQTLLDRLQIENGNLVFQPIVEIIGEDAVDMLVELLICIQRKLDTEGYDSFIQQIYDLSYWAEITNSIVENNTRDDRFE